MSKESDSKGIYTLSPSSTPPLIGSQSYEMRSTFLEWYFFPIMAKLFQRYNWVKGAYLAFAQYWNDEASDAVHYSIQLLTNKDLNWLDSFSKEKNESLGDYFDARNYHSLDPRDWAAEQLVDSVKRELFNKEYGFYYDNGDLIKAFASFTQDGFSQESERQEAYSPYLKIWWEPSKYSHKNADIELKWMIVGKMYRPHLENVSSEWAQENPTKTLKEIEMEAEEKLKSGM